MVTNLKDAISTLLFFGLLCVLAVYLSGCGVSARVDWTGETGLSSTTVSKEFVETKKPINERRY